MTGAAATQALIGQIEAVIQTEVGRNIGALCAAARGGLWGAAAALGAAPSCRVGLITGFYVPSGAPPAAETDGPIGAALLARGLIASGIVCRLATDEPCHNACAVALAAAGAAAVPVDATAVGVS
ncbi:MAG: glutamate cyclase domain-containing protein, partial [Stellaceae bacterium]